jgi:hypothetical protein
MELKPAPLIFLFLCLIGFAASAKEIRTNEVTMANAPDWLKQTRVEKVTDRIQQKLEWTIRRINVIWYATPEAFAKAHPLGPQAIAVTINSNGASTVHLGPIIDAQNFDEVFAHELVHVIVNQKYKSSIPKWLEEGLANHIAKHGKVDYAWLLAHDTGDDVHNLAHPFSGSAKGISYRYKASQALAEMLNKKCDLENLIRLSVQRNMEDYIKTYCEIPDLNAAFKKWIKKQAGAN